MLRYDHRGACHEVVCGCGQTPRLLERVSCRFRFSGVVVVVYIIAEVAVVVVVVVLTLYIF